MTVPYISAVRLGGSPTLPLLVLGPSLGTSARALWSRCAARLGDRFEVLAWDLPGHGSNTDVAEPFSMKELATGVRVLVDDVLTDRGEPGGSFTYAGDSVGGAVGLQLLLDAPGRVERAVLVCTGAILGTPDSWRERASAVRADGTAAMVPRATNTWFAPGFLHLDPAVGTELLQSLRDADDEGYAQVCEALASFDVRDRLDRISPPVVAVAGSRDEVTPVDSLAEIATGVRMGELVVLDDVAHLAPAESPEALARIIRGDTAPPDAVGAGEFAHALHDFQLDHARGETWSRPGLDRRTRSLVGIAAVVVAGTLDGLPGRVRAAVADGLTRDELREVLLQTSLHCGRAAVEQAFQVVQQVLEGIDTHEG